jgi:hypothetical protein
LLLLLCRRSLGPDGTSSVRSIRWDGAIGNPNVDERLHGLHVLLRKQAKELGDGDVVHKAAVEVSPAAAGRVVVVDVPERVNPVGVVEMRVDAEYLAEYGLAVSEEVLWEAGGFAKPITFGGGSGGVGACLIDKVGWEDFVVRELADDPTLDERNVLDCGNPHWLFLRVKPGIGMAPARCEKYALTFQV